MICSAWRVASWVRWSEAANGSWMPANMYPWSSSGRNPPGIPFPRRPETSAIAARPAIAIAALRMTPRLTRMYPSVARPNTRLNRS